MTYEQLTLPYCETTESTPKISRLSPQGSPASLTVLRERVSAMVTSVTCGERLQDVSENLNRVGFSVKIRPVYSQGKINGTSVEYLPTLPRWGIALVGGFGELATSERLTSEKGCLSALGTPTASMTKRSPRFARKTLTPAEYVEKFPTPLASDSIRVRYSEESLRKVGERRIKGEYKAAGCNLSEYVAVFPTPQATSRGAAERGKKLKALQAAGQITEYERKRMQAGNGGKLNPTWVEWLMGFPLGWTDLEDWETR